MAAELAGEKPETKAMRVAVDHSQLILQTAAKLFARKPYHEVLMDDVAEQAGIAKGTIYRHYPNKEELFAALSMNYLDAMGSEAERIAVGDARPLQRLEAMLTRVVEMVHERNDFFQVMLRQECERGHAEFLQRRARIRDQFVKVINEAVTARELNWPYDTVIAADMLMGMVRNVLRFSTPQRKPDEIVTMAMHMFVNGLKTGKSGGGK